MICYVLSMKQPLRSFKDWPLS